MSSGSKSSYFQESVLPIYHTCCWWEIPIFFHCYLSASYKRLYFHYYPSFSPSLPLSYVTLFTTFTGSTWLPAHTHTRTQSGILINSHTDLGSVQHTHTHTLHWCCLQSEIGQGMVITSCEEAHPHTGLTVKARRIIVRFCTYFILTLRIAEIFMEIKIPLTGKWKSRKRKIH